MFFNGLAYLKHEILDERTITKKIAISNLTTKQRAFNYLKRDREKRWINSDLNSPSQELLNSHKYDMSWVDGSFCLYQLQRGLTSKKCEAKKSYTYRRLIFN